ncbi:caspase domain-containing protein [Bradyrhizobium sp. JYMT SZCCT0428]|uniref:caspase family protein n=1 Tax=Bradyrhizobium sp. JYMT SZCCT0428 TaxID=2807673 RepID=UPI001BA85E7B|nr:caspase family protein [Bradyrhizobium sp. JYMT SZCCT0428]MBR1156544.1 caspase family protein [Bradyrhizobium sp. JYMT SZCCT0428]
MSTRRPIWIAALYSLVLLTCSISVAKADRRVALVVGNSNYSNASLFLANPKNDATDVAAALRGVGFEVLQAIDANKRDLDLNMAKFARLATDADAALFYYAGHAVQYQGRNFLMPTDAEVEDEISFRYQMTPLDDVRAALDRGDGVKIVILDACRNNPIVNALRRKKKSGDSRAIDAVRGGLAKIDKAQGMVVAYSTAADEVAADGDGRNSPFTSAFLKRLKEPGLEIEQLFRRVAADVNAQTGGRQRPETYVSLLSNYYLNQTDRIAFDKIKDSPDPAVLQDFIAKFSTSSYVPEAQNRIQRIEAAIRERQNQEARQREAARLAEEQRKAEREAALRKLAEQEEALRKQETLRAQAAAEKVRKEREAAQAQEEQRLRLVAEKERKEREAAKAQEEQRVKLAAERERKLREEAAQLLAEQAWTKIAAIDRKEPTSPSLAGISTDIRTVPPPTEAAPSPADPCDRDSAMLAQLRSNPSLEAVTELERSLSCEKLRAQILRLRESLSAVANAAPAIAAQVKPVVEKIAPPPALVIASPPPPAAPKQEAAPKPPEPKVAVATVAPAPECKKDEARLAKIRANPSHADLAALERDLGCERLRPQIVRLRESLPKEIAKETAKDAPQPDQPSAAANPPTLQSAQSAPSGAKPAQPAPIVQVRSCDEERATLAKLRASQSREDVVRFERELACEQLRPQVIRLRESLSGG